MQQLTKYVDRSSGLLLIYACWSSHEMLLVQQLHDRLSNATGYMGHFSLSITGAAFSWPKSLLEGLRGISEHLLFQEMRIHGIASPAITDRCFQ